MKKSLLALAILGAAAFSVQAANVTLYGVADAGFIYKYNKVKLDGEQVGDKTNTFKLGDGLDSANRVGIKGEEDIGNVKVGFKLEEGYHINNGNEAEDGKLFSREARLYVKSAYGELAAGRFGGLASAAGSYDIFFQNADAFDGGDNDVPYAFVKSGRYDNSVAYQSPEIAGFQGTLMYSFEKKGDQANKMKNDNRYVGAALTYDWDNKLKLVGVFEGQIRSDKVKDKMNAKGFEYKDGYTYSLGANYDFGVAKLFVGGQYAQNADLSDVQDGGVAQTYFKSLKNKDVTDDDFKTNVLDYVNQTQVKGYAFTLGTQIPFNNSLVTLAGYYGRYKNSHNINVKTTATNFSEDLGDINVGEKDAKMDIYGLSARYEYFLSKRTTIYTGAGYGHTEIKNDAKLKSDVAQAYVGLRHTF